MRFALERQRRGFDPIPEPERSMTLRQTGYFWAAAA
jgi:hypothetical protein